MNQLPIPLVLREIRDYLIDQEITFNDLSINNTEDGRIKSAMIEKFIISKILGQFPIHDPPKARCWFDFSITVNDVLYPVNIKVSNFGAADNLNCKLGIYYALTGKVPKFSNESDWNKFFYRLASNIKENDKDYYFLVLNKDNPRQILVQGLKTIRELVPNGNNLPFQCNWGNNIEPVNRPFDNAKDYLLSCLGKSTKLRANIHYQFEEHFPDIITD